MRKRSRKKNAIWRKKMTVLQYWLYSWIDRLFPKMVFGSHTIFFLLPRKTFPQTGIIPRLCQNRVGPCYKRRTRSHWVSEILWASAGHQDRREHAHGTIRGIPYYSLRPANNELTIRFQTWHAFLSSKACKIRSVLTLFHNHDWGVPTLLLNTTRYSKTQSTPEKNGYSWVIVRDSVSGID